jgi:N-acetylmuramoyl-L-alanine amidase
MGTTKPIAVRAQGCRFARRAARHASLRDGLVVLDFGRSRMKRGVFGTSLFGSGFRSTSQIAGAAEAYVRGFAGCLPSRSKAHLVIAIGTSNFGGQVTFAQGRTWASMVNEVADWVSANGHDRLVDVAGADDIELGWNGPVVTRGWVKGYGSVAEHPYFDYGDAAGCPPTGHCIGRWTVEDVWYVSWGAKWALPLPEIYAPNGSSAREWQQLSLYSLRWHGHPMVIAGAMSQRRACRQSADPCWGMNNSPSRAWHLLARALNSDPRTAQPVRWSTDVEWGR